ncbi:hypothetical protein JVT61DRAFT_1816 [Boletus reticuloceps]|uniref:Uncharacterized protein n=1 Tax=Boletus reticuloceps TaxID=495285 RepID=A0A8I2YU52_9AGAM|nr:hypothetical protein JVT61DRAFT_1816 [Boletus reticuloceps]
MIVPASAVFIMNRSHGSHTNTSPLVGFNPTNTTQPFIKVFDPSFLNVTGPNATILLVASHPGTQALPLLMKQIYVPELNIVFFASNAGGPFGYNGWYNNSIVPMCNLMEVNNALSATSDGVNIQDRGQGLQ